jgi:EmrB/QacA subfamily drug resistance transporter
MDDIAAAPANPAAELILPDVKRMRLTAVIVACALFMQNLDSTVIATALPTMARAFHADPTHMSAALTSYLISLAVFIPASGWIADRFGARQVFRAAIAVFTVGSVLCGAANSLESLILARIFQGMGGAMMVPVGRLVLLRSVAKSEIVAAMAWLTMPAMIGPVIGPPLGGFIVTYFSWRWIFDINIPIGVLGVVLVTLFVKDVREPTAAKFDLRGLGYSGVGLSCLMFGLETAGRGVVPAWLTAAMLGLAALCGLLYWRHARHSTAPLMDFTLMRIPSFQVSVTAGFLFRLGIGAIPFLLPLMLQLGFGLSPVESGSITFASSAGAMVMRPATVGMLRRFGFRDTLLINAVLSTGMLAMMAAFRPAWPLAALYGVLLLGGVFRSLQFAAFNALAYADIPRARMSAATSLYSTLQQVSLTFGVSVGAAALEASMALAKHTTPHISDFSNGFLVVAAASLLSAPLALMMPRNAGTETSGHGRRGV